ncbi:hypothetical protein G6F59_015820 [Rhizopus arrhizus]|nr:hypothetical protein G6F59_015820 [Rhizopus arrhizus]
MVSSAATRVALRPMRSPKWPNTAEPTGRAMNATAKVANDCSSAAYVEVEELNGGADQAGQQDTAGGIHGRCGSAGRRHRQHGLRHRSLHGCLADGCSCVVVVRFAEAAAHGGVAGGTAGAWPDGAVVVGQWPDRAAR